MKRNRKIIVGVVILAFIIAAFFIIKNLTVTKYGEINPGIAMNLQIDRIFNSGAINSKSIEENREKINRESTKLSKEAIPFLNIKDTNVEVNSDKIPVRIYTPEKGESLPVIIYSHGGSWIAGNLDTHDKVCRKLSNNTKAIVISVDYRLAPENPFPAGVNDVYNVLEWASKNAKSINGNEELISVVGDSAGGNISAVISQMSRDKNGPRIACQVLIYPSTNIYELNTASWSYFANDFNISAEEMEQYISLYIPKKEDRKSPYASPLLAKDFRNLPDALVVTAEIDPLRDEGEDYGNKLKEAGNNVRVTRVDGVTHGFITMDKATDKADEALNEVYSYIQNEFEK
ncbi:alpha/beta hydrolase [Clostridium sp.]|uniref:alpha/beta hydrolase n=1 Tax=Clostridium sp. TaxID=1506 RepID=UPI00284D651C|nr:alpha/beta hydrolase [Clostridium sp.]MDR3598602.1 alpha/beta hydrolase [Clostridium sp.]